MKYPEIKPTVKSDRVHRLVYDFMNGINDDSGKFASKNEELADCVNMEYAEGSLKTRPGFAANSGSLVLPAEYTDTVFLPFTVTDSVYYGGGKPLNLAYCCTGYSDKANLFFYFVEKNSNISSAGSIEFSRLDYAHFYCPKNVFFMVADKKLGAGVFAFVSRESDGEKLSEVYEASTDFNTWTNVSDYFYVPIVNINGRGENYDMAELNSDISLPEPMRLEELNLLTGKYKCYFTSDGFSAYFRLPYGDLVDISSLSCKIYTAPDEYTEWVIPVLGNHAQMEFKNKTIHLYLDRTLGILRFWDGTEDYSVPRMSRSKINNIVVTAQTQQSDFYEAILTSKGSVMLDNRIYCYGNTERQNCIFCSKTSNPFYFPQSAKLFLGDGTTPVTALKVQNGKLICFKPGETYRIITSAQKDILETSASLPEGSYYQKGDELKAQTIDNTIGCSLPDTIHLCGNRLVWLANDNSVWALATTTYGNTTNVFRVSKPIDTRLGEGLGTAENIFAATNGGQYMLFADKSVFVMNYRVRGFGFSKSYYAGDEETKSPSWFTFKLPDELSFISAAVVDGLPVFVSRISGDCSFYLSTQSGTADTYLKKVQNAVSSDSVPIRSGFITKYFDMGKPHLNKKLNVFLVNGTCEDAEVTLTDGKNAVETRITLKDNPDFLPVESGIPSFKFIKASFFCDKPFEISSMMFICDVLKKKV